MEIVDFKAGPQVATSTSGIVVRDINGVLWAVLKNIGNAISQPTAGQYYAKYLEPVAPAIDYKALYEARLAKLEEPKLLTMYLEFAFHPDDFYVKEEIVNGVKVQRIKIKR